MENSSVILVVFLLVLLYVYANSDGKKHKKSSQGSYQVQRKVLRPAVYGGVVNTMSNDYNDYILNTGIEQSVVDSHRKFVGEMEQRTSGASAQTTFSHDEDPSGNGWVGLRRPDYSGIYLDPNAREVPSSLPEHMPKNKRYDRCGLF